MTGLRDNLLGIQPEAVVDWNEVKSLVERYTERHPEEVIGCVEYVKTLRKEARMAGQGKYAIVDEASGRRHLYELPTRLHTALTLKYPTIFDEKNLRRFLKLYPIFCIPEKL